MCNVAYEDVREVLLGNGNRIEVGWGWPDVSGTLVMNLRRFRLTGHVLADVRLHDGRTVSKMIPSSAIARKW